jgi:hypothetical protein
MPARKPAKGEASISYAEMSEVNARLGHRHAVENGKRQDAGKQESAKCRRPGPLPQLASNKAAHPERNGGEGDGKAANPDKLRQFR